MMKVLLPCLVYLNTLTGINGHGEVLQIHGSGTTNPSKCLWKLMDGFTTRAKVPIHMTYRAVGSSTGIKEFIGVNNTADFAYKNYNDFAAADIPIPTESYNAMTDAGVEMVTLPFVIGAVNFFHNVDGINDSGAESVQSGLNLTACLLAKIFKREIVHWDDPQILTDNPGLRDALPFSKYSIQVARRVRGSSSTKSVTQYLNTACPSEWPLSMVGATVDWPADTMKCEGSGGMTECIRNTPGAIGYIDAGHGLEENLIEVELQNRAGRFLTTVESDNRGGIGAAASDVPDSADKNFGNIDLLNKDGAYTWPIALMSYIFVRKDLSSFIEDPAEQTLLKAFLTSLYDADTIAECDEFGFTRVPTSVKEVALAGIDMLEVTNTDETKYPDGVPTWTFETSTDPGAGQGDYVISGKRKTYKSYTLSANKDDDEDTAVRIKMLEAQVMAMGGTTAASSDAKAASSASTMSSSVFGDTEAQKIEAALIMSAISICLWGVALIAFAMKTCGVC